jgi:ABC-2 type transport system ATP-binding protein
VKIEEGNQNEIFKALQLLETTGIVDFSKSDPNAFEIQSKPELSSRKGIFKLCVDRSWILTEMTPVETKLEDIFRELTTH